MTKIEFKNLPDTSTPLSAENLNTMQDNIENAIDNVSIDLDTEVSTTSTNGIENQAITNYVNKSVSGDLVVDSIRTKNMFDKNTFVAGDITGYSPTIRLSSRQPIWLEAGTYTFSCNLTSPLRWGVNVQNVATPPLSSYTTYAYDSGWLSASTTSNTFTLTAAGWFCVMLSKENNATLTIDEINNFNYQLEAGDTATSFKPYQNLNNENDLYMDREVKIGNFMGKPLYRKVFVFDTTNNMSLEEAHNLQNIDKYYVNNGVSYLYGNNESLPINWYWSSSDYARGWMNSTKLRWRCPANVGGRKLYMVVEYTKTTD